MFFKINLRFISKLAILLTLSSSFLFTISTASAYEKYFHGDPNYEFAYIQMGSAFYVDKNSISSLLYRPPYYKLSAIIYSTNDKRNFLSYPHVATFEYHYDTKSVFRCDELGRRTEKTFIRTDSHASEADKRAIAAAKVIWKKAYGSDW